MEITDGILDLVENGVVRNLLDFLVTIVNINPTSILTKAWNFNNPSHSQDVGGVKWNISVCIFQFPIDPKTRHKWLEKCYPNDKFDKSTRRICSIYFSMAAFIDNMKFLLSNLNINNLILINFRISLKTNLLFRSFDHYSDKTVTLVSLYTLSGRTGSALVSYSEGRRFAPHSVQ